MCGTQAPPGAGAHTVFFEGCCIVYNGNKMRIKEMEREKNELIKNTPHRNHCI